MYFKQKEELNLARNCSHIGSNVSVNLHYTIIIKTLLYFYNEDYIPNVL